MTTLRMTRGGHPWWQTEIILFIRGIYFIMVFFYLKQQKGSTATSGLSQCRCQRVIFERNTQFAELGGD